MVHIRPQWHQWLHPLQLHLFLMAYGDYCCYLLRVSVLAVIHMADAGSPGFAELQHTVEVVAGTAAGMTVDGLDET